MAVDVRGHTVPAAEDAPARNALLALGLSINDPIVVADTTARAQKITDLASDGIAPSSATPLFFFRTDAGVGRQMEFTTDGVTFERLPTIGRSAPHAYAAGTATGSMAAQATVTIADTFPTSRFTVAPIVVPVLIGGSGYLSTLRVGVQSRTAAGVTFVVNSVTGASITGSITIDWTATQMTSSTAAG